MTSIMSGILFALPVYALALDVPHEFVAGQPALADQVNENFEALAGGTGRIFIAPKGIDSGLGDIAPAVSLNQSTPSFTAAYGRPWDYDDASAVPIDITPLLSGCGNMDVDITIVSNFFNIGTNTDNNITTPNNVVPMPAETTPITIEGPIFMRPGLGDVNYVTITRNTDACGGATSLFLHGIIIEYPR
jgi:hypothetical protein